MRKVPLILQSETDECGLACVAMVANYFGHELDLQALRCRHAFRNTGPSLASILALAELLDLQGRPLSLGADDLKRLDRPAVLHWNFDHFVVLTRVRRRSIEICDPAVGRRRVSLAEARNCFTGVAVEFSRMLEFRRLVSTARFKLVNLLHSFQGLGPYLAGMLILLFASQLLSLAIPVATQLLVDEVVLGQDERWLYRFVAGIGLILIAMIVIETLRRRCALFTGIRLGTDTAAAMVGHVLSLPLTTIERRTAGDLMSRIDSMQPIQKALTETLLAGVVQLVTLVLSLALMLYYSPRLTAVSIVALAIVSAVQALALPSLRARNLENVVATAAAKHSLIESLRGFASVNSFGLGPQRLAHWRHTYMRAINARAEQGRLSIHIQAVQAVVGAADQLVFLAFGIAGIAARDITLGMLFAILSLRGRLGAAVAALVGVVRELYLLRSHIDRVGELLIEPTRPDAPPTAMRGELAGELETEALSYAYPGAAKVIRQFDCHVAAGERVVICGPSGVGKTTLLQILSAQLHTETGAIRYDGVDAGLWDSDALRAQFGVVRQNDTLFMGSLADNVSCFSTQPDFSRIREVLKLACAWTDVLALPMKLQTPLNDGGAGLSGGQIQRLLIARALYRGPRIVFLDEATSQLDQSLETRVLANLASLEISIVSVAHGQNALRSSGRPVDLGKSTHGICVPTLP